MSTRWILAGLLAVLLAGCVGPEGVECESGEPFDDRAVLWGEVRDLAERPIEAAEVQATTESTGLDAFDITTADGCYSLFLKAGQSYDVRVHLFGYRDETRTGVRLAEGEASQHVFRLSSS